ncbi:DUF2624 domain-containing protein [Sporolactobacillus terrae]|uniref:DUF2624 domain-containing protein n=1 Tax=Sporolactobacillus terrae TaxID=269673 RepID=A0A410D9K5_9BACL|nr:DUF2624 family protein [Sporolactobacillus terrae]QAA22812.1 DUF2624 domain-containing protein [Sporolactobacillus terrae]QAA25785.1 DUF2624 domain-containing protein [Sporolactobacillus terrae]UAK17664.1 DUF2624 domain-containing protein [Sporolactobacillus terrae]BBN99207.1 hypothetical protein St703_19120 [Sporolactobacillus terrae]
MNPIIEQLVIQKMNHLTAEELYQYAVQFKIQVTKQQAASVAGRVRHQNINPFQPSGQAALRRILDEEIGEDLAEHLEKQFEQLAKNL